MEDKLQRSQLYLRRLLTLQGDPLSKFETNHIMILYFLAHGLDLHDALSPQETALLKNYVLSLQIKSGGWAPSSFYSRYPNTSRFDLPHIVFTYSAINILQITGGLDQINRAACLESVQKCEKPNGAYSSFANSEEADLRFVYSAVCICYALGDFSRMNKPAVVGYIRSCFNFDGGYSLRPHCQSHSGAIYCALAALKLLGESPLHPHRTLHFLVSRQIVNLENQDIVGIQGRVGKLPDSCYSFWVGASILMVSGENLVNPKLPAFIELCFKEKENCFSKYPESSNGDPVHTVHSIVGTRIAQRNHAHLWLERGIRCHPQH